MTDLVRAGPDATQRAKLPGLAAPRTKDPALDRWIQLVTERLEVREGNRGNPWERTATVRDLRRLGLGATTFNTANDITGGVLVQEPGGDVRLAKLKDLALRLQMVMASSGSTPAASPSPAAAPAPASSAIATGVDSSELEAGLRGVESRIQTNLRALDTKIESVRADVSGVADRRTGNFDRVFTPAAQIGVADVGGLRVAGAEVTTDFIRKPDFMLGSMDTLVVGMDEVEAAALTIRTRSTPSLPPPPPPPDPMMEPMDPMMEPPPPPPPPPPPGPNPHATAVVGYCSIFGATATGDAEIELRRNGMVFSRTRVSFMPGFRQTHTIFGADTDLPDGLTTYSLHLKALGVDFKYTEPALTATAARAFS